MYYLLSGFTRWRYPFVRLFVRRSSTRSEGGGGLSRRPHWLVYCNNCFTGVVRLEYVSAEDLGLLSSGRVLPQAVRGGAEAMTTERDELEQHGREDEDDEHHRWPRDCECDTTNYDVDNVALITECSKCVALISRVCKNLPDCRCLQFFSARRFCRVFFFCLSWLCKYVWFDFVTAKFQEFGWILLIELNVVRAIAFLKVDRHYTLDNYLANHLIDMQLVDLHWLL